MCDIHHLNKENAMSKVWQETFPFSTNRTERSPSGCQIERRLWDLLMNTQLLQTVASIAKPPLLIRSAIVRAVASLQGVAKTLNFLKARQNPTLSNFIPFCQDTLMGRVCPYGTGPA